MEIKQFRKEDIKDQQYLKQEIQNEASRIFNSPVASKGRSFDNIKASVEQGKVAEIWLTENFPFTLAKDVYHDLLDDEGNYVEVKAYSVKDSKAPYVVDALTRIANGTWNKSKYMLLFNYNQGTYTFLEKIMIR